jgi:hypothetical protein
LSALPTSLAFRETKTASHGVPASVLRDAVTRLTFNEPASLIGAALDELGDKLNDKITKSLGDLLVAVRDHTDSLVTENIVKADALRLTIAARAEEAQRLVDSGMSQRGAAKVLGVDKRTIGRDLGHNAPECGAKSPSDSQPSRRESIRTKNEELAAIEVEVPRETFETIVIDPPWPMTKIERDCRPNQVEFDYPTMSEDELRGFAQNVKSMRLKAEAVLAGNRRTGLSFAN